MAQTILRACKYGCPHDAASCPDHSRKAKQKAYNQRRGSASALGYGSRWRAFKSAIVAEMFRREVPRAGLCGARLPGAPETTDSLCAQQGLIVLGNIADHIIPVESADDPRFFDPLNIQLLCGSGQSGPASHNCHDRKRRREAQR